jgi:F0F1-type ATP synthase assembly protein I
MSNNEYLSLWEKLKLFASDKQTKEIFVVHAVIGVIASIVYLTLGFFSAVVFGVSALFVEMLAFHILWIYRRNPDKENRLWYAVKTEALNVIIAMLSILALVGINIATVRLFGVHTLIPIFFVLLALFFGRVAYTLYTTRIQKEQTTE